MYVENFLLNIPMPFFKYQVKSIRESILRQIDKKPRVPEVGREGSGALEKEERTNIFFLYILTNPVILKSILWEWA